MRGEPLHLCCKGHNLIMYTGAGCPFCTVLKENQDLKAKLGQVAQVARVNHAGEQSAEGGGRGSAQT